MNNFVHLHVHSDFSLQDAAVSVHSLADRAEELGMTHLALTDHGNMFGIMEFIAACRKREKPVNPIIGCEVYVSPDSRFEKKGTENENRYYHLVLLAANREGYFNLVKLCSLAYTEGFYYRPRVDEELLKQYHGGLIALSACVSGEIPRLIRAGKTAEAEQKALHYSELFGADEQGNPNFYLELQDHGIPAETLRGPLSQRDINTEIIAISRKTGIPLVATNDVHYLNREDYIAHDILLCIGTAKFRTDEKRKKYYGDQFYFKTADEMAELFAGYPEAIENTVRIAQRCVADVPNIGVKELTHYLPDFDIPPDFENADVYLRHVAGDGLAKRYAQEKTDGGLAWRQIEERCEYELKVIIEMGFTGYFLIVMDFINWAKGRDISVGPGRGSGAGSIVAYSLRITDIDPLKYGLLFERFLNPDRISMPDFDIDLANEGRDDVINYVTAKYGEDRVGQIITFGTLGAKAVIKDVARTLGISIDEAEKIAKLIPFRPGITLKQAFKEEPRLQEMEADPRYTEMFALARKLEGLNRHSSLHAAGVVIGKSVLHNLVPIFKDTKTGAIATQYDMNHLETCGLVKMDFLGLKTLDVIRHTEELIRRRGGEYANFKVETAPENDEATFKMLGEGQSFEIFQFASDGMRNILKQVKPDKIEDLIALNALYRPGPMENIPQFIDSKNGRQAIHYPDPRLEDVLKETYGVIVYQEQVMQVARIIAGYSLGQADVLRRAMGKKKKEILDAEKIPFLEGAVQQGYSKTRAGEIYDMLVPFAGYGFNKTHAAAYSVIAYHTAYLKANFPAEFMAANLTNEIHSANKEKLSECIDEARRMGIAIDPPDVNRCEKLFTIVDGRIIYGLLGIKGLGDAPADEIVRCRKDDSYHDFMDFLSKVDIKLVGKAVIEKLIQTGAFDRMGISRENLLGNLERAVEYAQKQKEEKKFGQTSLFGGTDEKEYTDFVFEDFPEISRLEKLKNEKQLIGFYFSGHPMDEYRDLWEKTVKVDLGHLDTIEPGNQILVGIIKTIRAVNSKSGKMAYITIADYNGEIEMIFFSRVWEAWQGRIQEDQIAIVRGKIDYQENRDKYSFIAEGLIDSREVGTAIAEEDALRRKREKFRNAWLYMADLKSGSLAKAEKGSYTIIGQLTNLRKMKDRNDNEMAFGTLHDFEGDIDLVFFSKVWAECRDILNLDEFTALKGSIDPANDRNPQKPSLKVNAIADIAALSRSAARKASAGEEPKVPAWTPPVAAAASSAAPQAVHVRLDSAAAGRDEGIYALRNYILGNPGPCPVFIHISANGEKIIRTTAGISLSAELKNCAGVVETWKELCV
ncbi:MAG: DNA polymerase III subunit alpha [Treponema sp.]|jgi:DNA polymerase-3 subunit alpha|nr:DNA polymerase III subunit alpha [Treponema sp.]